VEATDAEMNDAGADPRTVVARNGYSLRQGLESRRG
jgi:hypothetical protein